MCGGKRVWRESQHQKEYGTPTEDAEYKTEVMWTHINNILQDLHSFELNRQHVQTIRDKLSEVVDEGTRSYPTRRSVFTKVKYSDEML